MEESLTIRPIAHIYTDFDEKFGIPRQSGRVPELMGRVVFTPEFRNPDAIRGIEGFTHLWLIFDFSKAHREEWSPTVRPPRLGGNKRIGVFASRSPFRPNPLGLSSVKLEHVEQTEHEGPVLIVSGIDLLDKTPIFDIKPYLPFSDSHPNALGGYAEEFKEHRLKVIFPPELAEKVPKEKLSAITACLGEDPRPSYQNDSAREYSMRFGGFDIHFNVDGEKLTVTGVDK